MKSLRLLTAVYMLGLLPNAYATVTPKFQEVKIGLWIEGVGQDSKEEIVIGEHLSTPQIKVSRNLPEELSVVLEDKF